MATWLCHVGVTSPSPRPLAMTSHPPIPGRLSSCPLGRGRPGAGGVTGAAAGGVARGPGALSCGLAGQLLGMEAANGSAGPRGS